MAFAQKIDIPGPYHWKNRILLVFDEGEKQQMKQQLARFQEQAKGMTDRDLLIFKITESNVTGPEKSTYPARAAEQLRSKYNVAHDKFTVILIGKDGTEKLRQHDILTTEKLFAVIDAMPMRRREMHDRDGG